LAIGKEGQNARLAAKLTGWRIDIKSASAIEAERALVKQAAGKEEAIEAEELVEEAAEEEVPAELEPLAAEEAEEPVGAVSDFDLVLAGGVPSSAKSAETRQIRFAEDILPGRASKAQKKKGGKKEAEKPESKTKTKKARQKRLAYEDELEE